MLRRSQNLSPRDQHWRTKRRNHRCTANGTWLLTKRLITRRACKLSACRLKTLRAPTTPSLQSRRRNLRVTDGGRELLDVAILRGYPCRDCLQDRLLGDEHLATAGE